ncbi:MAG: sugar phosphate isomerase/epimerase family protein [Phototrophicaceae bacterium]
MDNVLLSANPHNFDECVSVAEQFQLGIEIQAFSFPHILDGDWKNLVKEYRQKLNGVNGLINMHGPFMDMAPGSPDPRINAICMDRYRHAIQIASELSAKTVVFHANFIASIHNMTYRRGWLERNIDFWGSLAQFAQRYNVIIAIENMWEFDPNLIGDILIAVEQPNLGTCLDIAHARLFGSDYPLETWLLTFQPWLVQLHMNNTLGKLDTHNALHHGVIDYHEVLGWVRELPIPLPMVLEMYKIEEMRQSLSYFELHPSNPNDH